jgi:hypothetical protein
MCEVYAMVRSPCRDKSVDVTSFKEAYNRFMARVRCAGLLQHRASEVEVCCLIVHVESQSGRQGPGVRSEHVCYGSL